MDGMPLTTQSIRHRSIHLVDVENLLGKGAPTAFEIQRCVEAYRSLGIIKHNDLIVVACNPAVALDVGLLWSPSRLLVRRGPSGADLALVDVARSERIDERFGHVVIASGDGIFVEPVERLQKRGIPVTVVAPSRCLARRLRVAANQVLRFCVGEDTLHPAAVSAG